MRSNLEGGARQNNCHVVRNTLLHWMRLMEESLVYLASLVSSH